MTERLESLAHLLVLLEHENVSLHIDQRLGYYPWRATFMESKQNPHAQMFCAEGQSLHQVLQESFRLFEEYRTSKQSEFVSVTQASQIDDALRTADDILRMCETSEKLDPPAPEKLNHVGGIKMVAQVLRNQLRAFAEGRKL